MQNPAAAPRRRFPIRLDKIKSAPAVNLIGLPEVFALVCALLLVLVTVFAYFYFYLPAGSRAKSVELERSRLQGLLQASSTQLDENQTTNEVVHKISASMNDFEENYLAAASSGRMALYNVLNNLIRSNGIRNTAGPTYSPLDPVGTKTQAQPTLSAEKQSNAKWQTIYPGVAVSVTVEGAYQNIRHFVRDIETSRQFLLINAIELERVTQSNFNPDQGAPNIQIPARATKPAPLAPVIQSSRSSGSLVSLRMDLATYFQRPETKTASAQ